jgi:hypothetical protein
MNADNHDPAIDQAEQDHQTAQPANPPKKEKSWPKIRERLDQISHLLTQQKQTQESVAALTAEMASLREQLRQGAGENQKPLVRSQKPEPPQTNDTVPALAPPPAKMGRRERL